MKKNKPIKRSPAIVEFSKDHHFALLLIWKIREGLKKSIEPSRISEYVIYFFENDLINHFQDEETILFNKLSIDNELRIQAETDHKDIYTLIDKLCSNPNEKSLLEKFANTLEKHIRFEERVLFNHIQQSMSEDELTKMDISIKSRDHKSGSKWDDLFWNKQQNKNYDTLTEALNDLNKRGFTYDFNLQKDCVYCNDKKFNPYEFHIVETHRFENMSDPSDDTVVYAIVSQKNDIKGILVNACGIYSDSNSFELISKFN